MDDASIIILICFHFLLYSLLFFYIPDLLVGLINLLELCGGSGLVSRCDRTFCLNSVMSVVLFSVCMFELAS